MDLTAIGEKMDQLISLVAANLVGGMKQNDAILFLGRVGLDRTLIADLVGTTPNTVSVRLSEAKAKKASAKKAEQKD